MTIKACPFSVLFEQNASKLKIKNKKRSSKSTKFKLSSRNPGGADLDNFGISYANEVHMLLSTFPVTLFLHSRVKSLIQVKIN